MILVASRAARALAIALLVAAAARDGRAQAPPAGPTAAQPTIRAGTRLATFDAVVTDGKGRHVIDLTPADFESGGRAARRRSLRWGG